MNISEKFYNDFGNKLLIDFAYGNPRIMSAINFTLNSITSKHKNILDIGCGIGWTSFEIARNFPELSIEAIDLSINSIEIATRLFNLSNLRYLHLDVTSDQFINTNNKYDLIILIDVFEHITSQERSKFVIKLSHSLNENGMVILTYPSPENQKWIKANAPSTLQPVDETIELSDLIDISNILNGKIRLFQYKDIWHSNDYIYAVFKRGLDFSGKYTVKRNMSILNYNQRIKLLKQTKIYDNLDWSLIENLIKIDYPGNNLYKRIKKTVKNIFFR